MKKNEKGHRASFVTELLFISCLTGGSVVSDCRSLDIRERMTIVFLLVFRCLDAYHIKCPSRGWERVDSVPCSFFGLVPLLIW